MFTSMTPGSGVTRKLLRRGSLRRLVSFEHHRRVEVLGRGFDRRHQLQVVLELDWSAA